MAEAFGIAGSAFGTVSLGLQLFKEISQYLDDIDGREEDLKQARNYANNIHLSISALGLAISNAPTNDPNAKAAIDSCKASCVAAVDNLLAIVKELRGPIPSPNSHTAKAKELCAKLKYPFKKQNVEKLEEHLSRTNSALQTILHVLQLNTGNATNTAIMNVQQTVADVNVLSKKNKTVLGEMDKTSRLHDERLSSIQQDVRELFILTRNSGEARRLLRMTAQQSLNITSDITFSASLQQDSVPGTALASIQTTRYQGCSSVTFDAFCSCRTQRTRYSRRYWGPFLLEAEVRSRDHHLAECPMSKIPPATYRTKRMLNFSIPTVQKLWGSASKVSLSFTTGAGILGYGQTLTWAAIVDEETSPIFRMVETVGRYHRLQREDMHILLASCFRRFVWCYTNHYASATDVNEYGESILERTLRKHVNREAFSSVGDNTAELFQMLVAVTEPQAYTEKSKDVPMLVSVARSWWFWHSTTPNDTVTAFISRCNESVGHHYTTNWLTEWLAKGQEYKVIQRFPQIAESLEFGPLSQAIVNGDQNKVQYLLGKCPSFIYEVNYCGQSPVHIATRVQNAAVLSVVLHYAEGRDLNLADNDGHYPIDYATTALGDHSTQHTKGQGNCRVCQVLELLLQYETAVFQSSIRFAIEPCAHSNQTVICVEGQKTFIRGLATRRQKLKELAYNTLSPAERRHLRMHQARILDRNAAQVQQHLEARACHIPTYLKVYNDNEPVKYAQSIYALISNGEVAKFAHESGFYYSDHELADFISVLAEEMSDEDYYARGIYRFSCSYFCWIVDRGVSVSSVIRTGQTPCVETELTAAHYLMATLGTARYYNSWALDSPLSTAAFEIAFSKTIVDKCRCWCSREGCTPLVKLLEGIYWAAHDIGSCICHDKLDGQIQAIEETLTGLCTGQIGKVGELSWIYGAIVRYYTFASLDLRHVCCCMIQKSSGPSPEEQYQEIQEEDSFLLELFENLTKEFEQEYRHGVGLEGFFEFMRVVWAPRMREVEQDLASQRLADKQLRDAELIGVVWEDYGPQPVVESPQDGKELGDLWDAMNELDEIATDPERPLI
ncbi:hypothetical protein IWW34DRAFT_888444 [Fusarium oxysporum f. sp. albedinis]|nr:hypothetical protein IWW34DRAFT_888444 [Fusarium oxysporum f. sp. albedinis]KAJ0133306.1 ATP-dependent DNA helicase [Fusarium oxysporum f. sp. albedinis]